MDEQHIEIGMIVREYRQKKGMTQLDLSKILGYETTQFVSLFERGLSKIPFATLGQLVIILGIPEKKIMETLVKGYEQNLKQEIIEGKVQARKKLA